MKIKSGRVFNREGKPNNRAMNSMLADILRERYGDSYINHRYEPENSGREIVESRVEAWHVEGIVYLIKDK